MKSFKKPATPTKAPPKKGATGKPNASAGNEKGKDKPLDKSIATRAAMPPSSTAKSSDDDVSGEVNSSDIKLPYLSLVQGVGDLSANFTPGQFVVAGEVELTEAPKKEAAGDPIDIVVVWAKKQFLERVAFDSGEMGRIFDTAEAAQKEGLTTEWVDNEPPSAGPMLTCLVLIEETTKAAEMESPYFSLEYDGKKFAPCMWRLKSTAYNRAGKAILTAKALSRREPLSMRKFTLNSKREKVGQNWIYTPVIRATGKQDQDFVDFVAANS